MPLITKRLKSISASPLFRYLLPFFAVGTAIGFQTALSFVVSSKKDFPYAFLYLIAVFVVAWLGGYVPGVIACLLTMVAIPLAVVPGFRITGVDPSRLILFAGVSLLVSRVADIQRRSRKLLRQANDELEERVRSRTLALESEVAQHRTTEGRLQAQLERLNLLDQITRAIGERQDLRSVFQVVIRTLEDSLPIDFGCVCLYDPLESALTVTCVGVRSEALALELAMPERARIDIDQNGLSHCVLGHLVYEPDTNQIAFPFPQRLSRGGLSAMVAAPLQSESKVFGVLIASRRQPNSFTSGDCEFLRQLSGHVALAAQQAQIYSALQEAYDDLRQTQQTVMQQERLRALGQMASGIAHDINNAISPVMLYTDVLLETEPNLSARSRDYLVNTQRSIEDVAHTVSRMREFYRQQELQMVLTPVDLSRLAQQVADLTRARWEDMPLKRGVVVELRSELAPNLPPVAGVESEIREALINLVFNAVDAMPEGGVLTIRTRAAKVGSTAPQAYVEVGDTGVGMDEETRRRCLEPFFTTKGERGTGLGLAMVFGVTQRHNAEIEIESASGKGTVMRLIFPVPAAPALGATESSRPATIPSRLRILVVDDDPLLLKSLRDTLEVDGHAVTTASGGQAGIDAFRSAQAHAERFSVVITDLGMPYIDGRKVANAVKSASPSTPVILLTGWGQRLVADGEVPPHVDRVLNKPPKLRELRAALTELVSSSGAVIGR